MKQRLIHLLLGANLILALLLASCTRPPATHPPQSEPIGSDALPALPDSVTVVRTPSALDKLLGRTPKPWKVAPIVAHQPVSLGKKSTLNVYYGAVTNAGKKATVAAGDGATATTVAKADAPVATSSGDATDNTKAGQRGGAAATASGATATATTTKPGFWAAALPGLGILASIGLVYWLVAGGGVGLLAALWRKNKPAETQA